MIPWAVIPTAGRGTRMYPAAAVIPKVLLPVGTWPMLHWALEEAVASGIPGLALVIGPEQQLIRDYVEACTRAARRGDLGDLADLGRGLQDREIRWIEQARPLGVGDAFMRCRSITAGSPFAVLLPDNWFDSAQPATAQVFETYLATGLCTLAMTSIDAAESALFGNVGGVDLEHLAARSYRIVRLQDKLPGTFECPPAGGSVLRGCARYVLDDRFYDALSVTGPPPDGEWDDVPAFQWLIAEHGLAGHHIDGTHYDVGMPRGYLAAAAHLYRARGVGQR